jgi:diguanylate cyclase (GGDEF)-like protein
MMSDIPRAELERRLEELEAIHENLRALTSTLDLAEILRIVLGQIKALASAEGLSLLLYDRVRDELVFAATETLRENSLIGRKGCGVRAMGRDGGEDVLSVPLRQGEVVAGAIELAARYDGQPFTAEDRQRAAAVGAEIEAAVRAGDVSHDGETLRRLLAKAAAAVPSRGAALVLYDPSGQLVFRSSRTLERAVIDGVRLRMGQGIAGWVARNRQSLRLDDVAADPRHDPDLARRTGLRPRTMLCVPILNKDALLGVIQLINKVDGTAFDEHELRLVERFAGHAAIAIEHAFLYAQAELAGITDDLTGLANTRHFSRVLPDLLTRGGSVSLIVMDLDDFKPIVDRYGHLVGSRTIARVGRLIADRLRADDVAARFGGDEFVVILPGTGTVEARAVAEQIRAAVEACRTLDVADNGGDVGVDISGLTVSIGVASFPDHASDADELFRVADAAMYAVKRGRKNGVAVARR